MIRYLLPLLLPLTACAATSTGPSSPAPLSLPGPPLPASGSGLPWWAPAPTWS
jgi:hypothetical protein